MLGVASAMLAGQNAPVSLVLGIDVGGTKVAVARIEGARAHDAVEHPTDLDSSDELLDGIAAAVAEVGGSPDAIGIGVPSQVEFSTGTVLSSVNIPLAGVPLREELGTRFGIPVFVDNDANCAALAEAAARPEPPAEHLVMLTLGTGVGGGIVIDGRIERGHTGLGAELGHVDPGRRDHAGRDASRASRARARWSGSAAAPASSAPPPKRPVPGCRDARR